MFTLELCPHKIFQNIPRTRKNENRRIPLRAKKKTAVTPLYTFPPIALRNARNNPIKLTLASGEEREPGSPLPRGALCKEAFIGSVATLLSREFERCKSCSSSAGGRARIREPQQRVYNTWGGFVSRRARWWPPGGVSQTHLFAPRRTHKGERRIWPQ